MKLKILIGMSAYAAASAPAQATTSIGYVQYPFATATGIFMFDTSTDKSTPLPGCVANSPVQHRWAVDASTIAGQAVASVVLSAYSLHKRVYVTGTGACNVWSDTEGVQHLFINEN